MQANRHMVITAERNLGFGYYNNPPLPPISVIDMSPSGFGRAFGSFGDVAVPAGQSMTQYMDAVLTSPTPLTNVMVDAAMAGTTGMTYQQVMEQYLQGNLPNVTMDPSSGALVPKATPTDYTPILMLAGLGIGVWMFMKK